MANCKRCDVKLSFINVGDHCYDCGAIVAREVLEASSVAETQAADQEWIENEKRRAEKIAQNNIKTTPAATTFTTIAWLFVGLGLICTVTSALLFAEEGQAFLAAIVFISGCFGAVLLGLLAEISSNLAKLVNNSR
jgi:hypothetical protein